MLEWCVPLGNCDSRVCGRHDYGRRARGRGAGLTSSGVHLQHAHQMAEIKWLADMVVHARFKTSFPIRFHGVSRHCNDGQLD